LISRGWHLEWAVDLEQHPCLPHRLGSSTWTTLRATASPPPQDQSAILRVRRVGLLRPTVPTRRPGQHPTRRNPAFKLPVTSSMRNTASLQTRPEAAVPGAARNDETARSRRLPSKWRTMQKIALPAMASRAQRQVLLIGI
jgi:hypothetical protein